MKAFFSHISYSISLISFSTNPNIRLLSLERKGWYGVAKKKYTWHLSPVFFRHAVGRADSNLAQLPQFPFSFLFSPGWSLRSRRTKFFGRKLIYNLVRSRYESLNRKRIEKAAGLFFHNYILSQSVESLTSEISVLSKRRSDFQISFPVKTA